jgi:hypothetical protein
VVIDDGGLRRAIAGGDEGREGRNGRDGISHGSMGCMRDGVAGFNGRETSLTGSVLEMAAVGRIVGGWT